MKPKKTIKCWKCGKEIKKGENHRPDSLSWHHFFNKNDVLAKLNTIFPKQDNSEVGLIIWKNLPQFPTHVKCHENIETITNTNEKYS